MSRKMLVIVALLALGVLLVVAGCAPSSPTPTGGTEELTEEAKAADMGPVPYSEVWAASGHADITAEAFTHWNEEDPKEIPVECAKCHSTEGYQDFVGSDGSAAGTVDKAAPVGSVINCQTCHNDAAAALTSVVMPSGVEIKDLGPSARCMQCHQGRASGLSVAEATKDMDPDTANPDLGFINIHYFAAAGTLFGSETHAGFEYEGKAYQMRNIHVEGVNECIDCHNQHTLELRVETCTECHGDGDPKDYRMQGSLADYDGDGSAEEGISSEIDTLREMLMTAMQSYATEKAGAALAYTPSVYPYFVIDTNGDGQAGDDEANAGNRYASWTPRLLKAAYNYQVATKDPGAFAHNPKYIIALLYDSIEDLNSAISSPVDLSAASRNDPGHFDGTGEPFRHWDEEGKVAAGCSKCHSATGLPQFLAEGANISNPLSNGFACTTCHDVAAGFPALYQVAEVPFPSGAVLSFGENEPSNLCIECHQGRSSTPTLDKALAGKPPDTPDEKIRFSNIHYFAAGATLFGSEAQGAYQYEGKEYLGRFMHTDGFQQCRDCHEVHELEVKTDVCEACHQSADTSTFRMNPTDWDGDGDTTEGIKGEIDTSREKLYAAIQQYAADKGLPAIVYDPVAYPYFFADTDGNGEVNGEEAGYASWTPTLLKAAYNYQYSVKDPGAFAHNGKYVLQFLYDSIEAIGGSAAVQGMTRP
jgi:hypothetical protein